MMSPSRALKRAVLLAALAPLVTSCIAVHRQPGVTIATSPPGARVIVDGKDSGFVTPCDIELPRKPQVVTLALSGYQTVDRNVYGDKRRDLIYYDEAFVNYNTWRFPLWLNYEDGIFPFKVDKTYSPTRIFVRMRLDDED